MAQGRAARRLEIVIAAGTPGTGVPRAVSEICSWVNTARPEIASQWAVAPKFEALLLQEYNARRVDPKPAKNIIPLLEEPKPILRELWSETLKRLRREVDRLAKKPKIRRVFVPIHHVWYHQRLREYVSVLNPSKLRKALDPHKIVAVLCLIDDIYDVYSRLRQHGLLYDRSFPLDPGRSRRGHVVLRHLRLLDWRAKEILQSEALADALNIPVTVVAVKHRPSVAFGALTDSTRVYLSHPITEPRRLEVSSSPELRELGRRVKDAIWEVAQLLSKDFTVFEPSTIDEYRVDSSEARLRLSPRFFPLERYSDTLFTAEGCVGDAVMYEDETDEGLSDIETAVGRDLAETLTSFIENQVTARDLRLVSQSNCLVVYRPRFNGNLSSGVREEIDHFVRLQEFDKGRYRGIVLVDSKDDAEVYPARQFVEAMIAQSAAGAWSPRLQHISPAEGVAALSDATRQLVSELTTDSSDDAIGSSLEAALGDLGVEPSWTLDNAGKVEPLGQAHTYPAQQKQRAEFLQVFRRRLTPFEGLTPYSAHRVVWCNEKTPKELERELKEILAES